MAKLDQILLKHSTAARADFVAEVQGTANSPTGPNKLEPGEVVIRRDSGYVELWSLDANNTLREVAVDLTGQIPPWDPNELKQASLGLLKDVNLSSGIQGGLGGGQAGWILTWDGATWVPRPAPGMDEINAAIPSLNNIGDVNYAYWSTQGQLKFVPVQGDILRYEFNSQTQSYQWAPLPLAAENLEGWGVEGGRLYVNGYNAIGFSPGPSNPEFNYHARLSGGTSSLRLESFGNYLEISKGQVQNLRMEGHLLLSRANPVAGDSRIQGIKYDTSAIPLVLPDDTYLPALRHVRADFETRRVGELEDVDDSGILAGQVLAWDPLRSKYTPKSGIAPDLSLAELGDLRNVDENGIAEGLSLVWSNADNKWAPRSPKLNDATWDNFDFFYKPAEPDNRETNCKECNEENLGRITVVENKPYVCLRARSTVSGTVDDAYSWTELLLDSYNRTHSSRFPARENFTNDTGDHRRTAPLAAAAFQGTLGSLYNVSTADVFPWSAIVYNPNTFRFEAGYPALRLSDYSLGEVGDVAAEAAGVGYGLLWDGSNWVASSLDQKVRLDDLQDVQFGDLGVQNTKLVAAYMLAAGPVTGKGAEVDLSPSLAVSTPKQDAQLGSTLEAASPDGKFYPNARLFAVSPDWPIAQKLDNYVRWNLDNSWQQIDGDGCIEVFFFPTAFLENRTIFRKVATVSSLGGYILRLKQDGSIEWSVSGTDGATGFLVSTPINTVSINNWHHVAITKEGAKQRLYLDGFKVLEVDSLARWTGDGQFLLGRNDLDDNNTLTHNFFRGLMLDLRVTRGRAKYTGDSYAIPSSLEAELLDTTPTAGDFLSFDGTKWTNVAGLDADISSNSITELIDVDTTSKNPGTGDALVWTGTRWEPGVPGTGSSWSLDDLIDVQTSYQASTPYIQLNQAELIQFSTAFGTANDSSVVALSRGESTYISYYDDSNHPQKADQAKYVDERQTFIAAQRLGQAAIRARRAYVKNVFYDDFVVPRSYHETVLHYDAVPNRGADEPTITGAPEATYIPCWGVVQDFINDALEHGNLSALLDVSTNAPTNGQALVWNATAGIWEPRSDIAADVSQNSLQDLLDVDYTGLATGMVLQWDGAKWLPEEKFASIFEFGDVNAFPVEASGPFTLSGLRGTASDQRMNQSSVDPYANTIFDLGLDKDQGGLGVRGFRGLTLGDVSGADSEAPFYLYGVRANNGTSGTVALTSAVSGNSGAVLELNPKFIRISDLGNSANGSEGFRLAAGWRAIYEDNSATFLQYGTAELPTRGAIQDWVQSGLDNLDLAPNSIDNLGDVDTSAKSNGYALTWNEAAGNWVASADVAANISLASIGELADVVKVPNADPTTNDGSLSFDVGKLLTSRPHDTNQSGGLQILSVDETSGFIWDDAAGNTPTVKSGSTFLKVSPTEITASGGKGVVYSEVPTLGDKTIPSWLQVKQQILKQQTDFSALLLLDGDDFIDKAYGWTVDTVITTTPNPVYLSPFGGHWSYSFKKANGDRLTWTTANGSQYEWNPQVVWSIELFAWVSSADQGDGKVEYLVAPAARGATYTSSGIHIGLRGDDRSQIFATLGTCASNSVAPFSTYYQAGLTMDGWNHVYLAHEGGGSYAFFVNGALVGRWNDNSTIYMSGGITFGGQSQDLANNLNSYFTGLVDDIRITRSWVPYSPAQPTVPVPVEPLSIQPFKPVFGTLGSLADVSTAGAFNGQALIYNNINQTWEPGTAPAYDISANSLSDLADADTTTATPDEGDVLGWNAANSQWQRTKVDGNGGIRPLSGRTVTPGVVPSAGQLFAGELFINMADKKAYALDDAGQPFEFANGGILDEVDTRYDRVVGGTF